MENIVKDLPTRYAICDWNLVYSSQRDGYSLNTCLNFSKNRSGPSLLVIKDSFGHIFGAFASVFGKLAFSSDSIAVKYVSKKCQTQLFEIAEGGLYCSYIIYS